MAGGAVAGVVGVREPGGLPRVSGNPWARGDQCGPRGAAFIGDDPGLGSSPRWRIAQRSSSAANVFGSDRATLVGLSRSAKGYPGLHHAGANSYGHAIGTFYPGPVSLQRSGARTLCSAGADLERRRKELGRFSLVAHLLEVRNRAMAQRRPSPPSSPSLAAFGALAPLADSG